MHSNKINVTGERGLERVGAYQSIQSKMIVSKAEKRHKGKDRNVIEVNMCMSGIGHLAPSATIDLSSRIDQSSRMVTESCWYTYGTWLVREHTL